MAKTILRDKCNLMSHELIQAGISTGYNQGHLIHYMKLSEYILDKYKRTREAWAESDARRVREYKELMKSLPEASHKKPCVEKFSIGPCHLNLSACASSDLP